ncbi:MAG TPA: class I SAM-dependent methyltransferase [Cytophagales bacterium]|nr:class I SAM-dependent methyltransferase [Cytophagales bacterium]
MEEEQLKAMAAQLRKPDGPEGTKIGKWMNEGNAFMNMSTIKALNITAHDNILEIGMGNGIFVHEILDNNATTTYTGCDFSNLMVEESIQNNQDFVASGRAKFQVQTADRLPYPNHSFTKIFTVNTLYFWEDTSRTFGELHRVLSPTGTLIIAIRPKQLMQKMPMTKYGFNMFTKDELCTLIENNNFLVLDVQENTEPPMDFNGQTVILEHIIVKAIKK